MEKEYTAKLIRHKRRQRDKLVELLIWGLIGTAIVWLPILLSVIAGGLMQALGL